MKIGLPLKLGILVIALFALVIAGCLLYNPLRFYYWRSKLLSENKTVRDKAIRNLIAMPGKYHEWLMRDCLGGDGKYSAPAAEALMGCKDFSLSALEFDDFLTYVKVIMGEKVREKVSDEYLKQIRTHLKSVRPKGRNKRYYDVFYLTADPISRMGHIYAGSAADPWFLVETQLKYEGYWFSEDGTRDGDLRTSGLAILAFLGHGQTHRVGKFKKVVRRALKFLKNFPDENTGKYSDNTFVQAACVMAMCEAYAVTRDNVLKKPSQTALDYLLSRQLLGGGFPERVGGKASDVMATCWSVLAAKAAKMGKLKIREGMFDNVLKYFDENKILLSEREEDLEKVAAATLSSIFCGRSRTHLSIQAASLTIDKYLPSWEDRRDLEYNYFGTYAKFQIGGPTWKTWNTELKKTLPPNQKEKDKGCLAGSWDPVMGEDSKRYGRNYSTALSTLTMEIYYRYDRAMKYMKTRKK